MRKLWKMWNSLKHKDIVWVLLGLLAVSLITLPYLVLGEGSYVQVHDQLDGEVLNYMYQARYLGRGNVIPQFMNGMDKASMLPPAPLGVLLYKILPPFAAYGVMHWLCLIVGFLGMYGLCKKLGLRALVSWAAACLFCYIPFYPVYGLAALGQPMLTLCGLGLREEKTAKVSRRVWYFLGIALFAACSSLTLVGFVWVAVGFLWTAYLAAGRRRNGFGPALRVGCGTLTLLGVYLACNMDLLRSLTGQGFATHRQEMALRAAEHPLESLKDLIFSGGSYSPVYSAGILAAAVLLTLVALLLAGRRSSFVKSLRVIWGLIGLIFLCALLAVLWNCGPVVSLRLSVGGMITYFQADRVYWCFPFLWMLVLGLVLESACRLGEQLEIRQSKALWPRLAICAACLLLLGVEGLQILRDSTLNKNIRLMLFADYRQVTWESVYMEDVFAQIDRAIGEDKENYSVVSLGIYPSVALYHGYTCADGYSNNYDLEYKHRFRQVMARELEENEETRRYFDDWGNRLYLAGAPYGINGMVGKGQEGYTELDYDLDAMNSLHIRYLLAAAPVDLSLLSREQTALTLELVEGSPFTDDTAYYEVWVYRICNP
ncbi:MAG: hypothetical protein K2I21_02040 [Acetatifactor sp.]|nr:hypothetical protein [Acetatifactor sp.]